MSRASTITEQTREAVEQEPVDGAALGVHAFTDGVPAPEPPPASEPAKPAAELLHVRVGNLETRESHRELDLMDQRLAIGMVLQEMMGQINEVRRELGLPEWKPTLPTLGATRPQLNGSEPTPAQ